MTGGGGDARRERSRMLFLFIDGVGIGRGDPSVNPLAAGPLRGFEALLGGPVPTIDRPSVDTARTSMRAIDATLGVGGLPQSGTGQTTILTGENAAARLGMHHGPFPHTSLRALLAGKNLFLRLEQLGLSTMYLNAFPARYVEHAAIHPGRTGAFSFAWRSNDRPLNGPAELAAGRALSADITAEGWMTLAHPGIPVLTPAAAGASALRSLRRHDFVLFEYYLTDHAGHGRRYRDPAALLATLDEFVDAITSGLAPDTETLLITSDHGNLEDLSTRGHTTNPVPLIVSGKGHARLVDGVSDLAGIAPAIIRHFEAETREWNTGRR